MHVPQPQIDGWVVGVSVFGSIIVVFSRMAKTESVWIKEEVEEDSINDNDKKVKMELLYIAGGSQLNPK